MKATMPSRSRSNALWRRIAPANAMRGLTTSLVLGALFSLGVYFAREPATVWLANLSRSGGSDGSVKMVYADPVARFTETRVGHLLFKPYEGDHCRRVLFDNRSGGFLEAGKVFCGRAVTPEETETGASAPMPFTDRIQTLSKAFRK